MRKREIAATVVAANWRIQQRLPRITQLAAKLGLIKTNNSSLNANGGRV